MGTRKYLKKDDVRQMTAWFLICCLMFFNTSLSIVDAAPKPGVGNQYGNSAFAPGHNKIIPAGIIPSSGNPHGGGVTVSAGGSVNPAGNTIGASNAAGKNTILSPQGYTVKVAGKNMFVVQPGSNIVVKLNIAAQTAKIGKGKFVLAAGDAFSEIISAQISASELVVPDPIGAKGPNPHHGGTHPKKGDGNPGGGNENNNGHWGEGNHGNGVGNIYTGNQGRGVGEGMAGGRHGDTDTDNDNDLDNDLDNDTDTDTDTDDDVAFVPPLARRESADSGGCPALMQWLANELGTSAQGIQVYVSNTFALSSDISPCQSCAKLQNAAAFLDDADGVRLAALEQVLNEFITPNAPITDEQMILIVSTISQNVDDEDQPHYASAGEYLDALAAYIGIITEDFGFSTEQAVTFLNENHSPSTENVGLTTFIEARIAAISG
ncbi:MAG: hypothetical protein ACYTBP_08750 [Planctomycetota bacterium]|jgi:hypothetical protein